MDPVYGYQAVNVEAEQRHPTSFLQWFRQLLAVRKQHPLFGLGSFEALNPHNPAIFPYVRKWNNDIVLIVNNVAGTAQAAELDLSPYEGMYPVEMMGGQQFPRIGELPYLLTFGPHSFYWFQLLPEESV
jgi:maltose alpha-D-glucosyltransferase/alpha-amylase